LRLCSVFFDARYEKEIPQMKKLLLVGAVAVFVATPVAAAPPTLTLKATPTVVAYGGSTTLSGVLSSGKTGQSVDIQAQECGQNALKKLTSVNTTTGGAFAAAAKPAMKTTYQAKQKGATSPTVAVQVSPSLTLKKTGGKAVRRFTVTLTSAQSFVGKYVVFQRRGSTKWKTVKKVTLTTVAATTAPTQVTTAKFSARILRHPKVRVLLPAAQAGTCYLPAKSPSVRS
jgi:hypothetical protein